MEDRTLLVSTQNGGLFDAWNTDAAGIDGYFKMMADCGIEAIDYNLDHFLPTALLKKGEVNSFWDQSLDALYAHFAPTKEAAQRHGVRFSQSHAPFPLYAEDKDEFNEYLIMVMEKAIAVCAYLGCPAVVAHPVTLADKEKEKQVNLNMYRRLIPAAKQYGVTVCLENMIERRSGKYREGCCGTAAEACWYLDTLNEEAGAEVFGFCFDVGHANLSAKNLREYLRALGKRLTILHIHDNDGRQDLHLIPYTQLLNGQGEQGTPWEDVIGGLKDIGYRGTLSFETFRGVRCVPEPVRPAALQLISAIGRYFRQQILA